MSEQEPIIVINGTQLTAGQAMSVRVAVTSFITEMRTIGLGKDTVGKSIAENYAKRLSEVVSIMSREDSNHV